MLKFLLSFVFAFLIAIVTTFFVKKIAVFFKILDLPSNNKRKIHKKPIPLLGGLGIFVSFFIIIFCNYLFFNSFESSINFTQLFVLFISSIILMIGGFIDDKYDIGVYSFVFPFLAIIILLFVDLGFSKITNPFGGVINLNWKEFKIFTFWDVTYYFTFFTDLFMIFWLLGMTYTTKLLDGLDGLVSGMTAIGSFMIFLLSLTDKYYQPEVALISIILCGACLGFLVFNFHPATIFLGEGGSVFLGFMLGVLAIISGGKIATALLVMGIPILDMIWVILRRIKNRQSIAKNDAMHMHHRLLQFGLTHRQVVLSLYILSFSFGITTLFLQSLQKIFALGILIAVMLAFGSLLVSKKVLKKDI